MTDVTPTGAVHPVAALFPLLADDELQELADDIAANGLRQPIVLDADGVLLDGRNRLAACQRAEVAPTFTIYDGDAVALIISANVRRRHLSQGQKAMAVALARCLENKQTIREAAASSGTNAGAVGMANIVIQYAPDRTDAVMAGTFSLADAYQGARWTKQIDEETAARAARGETVTTVEDDQIAQHAHDLAKNIVSEALSKPTPAMRLQHAEHQAMIRVHLLDQVGDALHKLRAASPQEMADARAINRPGRDLAAHLDDLVAQLTTYANEAKAAERPRIRAVK